MTTLLFKSFGDAAARRPFGFMTSLKNTLSLHHKSTKPYATYHLLHLDDKTLDKHGMDRKTLQHEASRPLPF